MFCGFALFFRSFKFCSNFFVYDWPESISGYPDVILKKKTREICMKISVNNFILLVSENAHPI